MNTEELVHFAVTRAPTEQWTEQQLREATPYRVGPHALIRDGNKKYGPAFDRVAEGAGIEVLQIAACTPRMNVQSARDFSVASGGSVSITSSSWANGTQGVCSGSTLGAISIRQGLTKESMALERLEGAAADCMLDNSSIIIAHGTGKDAVPAPEMAAFGERFGFRFLAHKLGDKDRSARVERPFHYIENNFYPHRTFQDVPDLNCQFRQWCDRVNAKHKRSLRAAPRDLFVVERPALKRLPSHIPTPTEVHHRSVDSLGYVTVHTNSYSVPAALLDRQVQVLAITPSILLSLLGRFSRA